MYRLTQTGPLACRSSQSSGGRSRQNPKLRGTEHAQERNPLRGQRGQEAGERPPIGRAQSTLPQSSENSQLPLTINVFLVSELSDHILMPLSPRHATMLLTATFWESF